MKQQERLLGSAFQTLLVAVADAVWSEKEQHKLFVCTFLYAVCVQQQPLIPHTHEAAAALFVCAVCVCVCCLLSSSRLSSLLTFLPPSTDTLGSIHTHTQTIGDERTSVSVSHWWTSTSRRGDEQKESQRRQERC